jgi:anti-sigma-K factor RskA
MGVSEHREEYLDLCAAYALGSLDPAERGRLEAHLAEGCPQCEAALADFGAASVLLATTAPAMQPSPALKGRVMAAVRAAGPAGSEASAPTTAPDRGRVIEMRPRTPLPFASWGWMAAAATLAIATGISWNTASHLRTELESNRAHLSELEQKLADEQRWVAVLNAPRAKLVELTPTPQGSHDLVARATYDPATQRAVLVFENFKAPTGHDYELWAIRGTTPAPASLGLIKPDESGHAVLQLENVGDPATLGAFAVSLERAGGSGNPNAPGGPVVMVGKLGG